MVAPVLLYRGVVVSYKYAGRMAGVGAAEEKKNQGRTSRLLPDKV